MISNASWIGNARAPFDEVRPLTELRENKGPLNDLHPRHVIECGGAQKSVREFVAIIEANTFFGECFRRSIQSALTLQVLSFSSVDELIQATIENIPSLIILSRSENNKVECGSTLKELFDFESRALVIVLGDKNNSELLDVAISHGARGYIPLTMEFGMAIEAVRFVLAGGTYVPMDCVHARISRGGEVARSDRRLTFGAMTARELSVVRAIQQGKSNKVIARELNLCENTVKVHVRHVMRKLNAKNRTEAAFFFASNNRSLA